MNENHTTHDSLSAYVDGELSPGDAALIADHLATCAHCSAEYNSLLETIALLRSQLERYTAPDVLRARIRGAVATTPSEPAARVGTAPPAASSRQWVRTAVWAASLVLAVALGSGGALVIAGRDRGASAVAGEVLASHVRSLMPDHLTDVRSSDQHNVKPWFNGRLDYSPSVPRLDDRGFPLIGGRLDYIGGRPVAVVVYGRRQHLINVFSWPQQGTAEPTATTASRGYTMIHWRSGGTERWVVSDVNPGELQSFSDLLRRADSSNAAISRYAPPSP